MDKKFTDISTHTLTWSVTGEFKGFFDKLYISTHTLTWSVTYILINRQTHTQISTHTLTWSVTKERGIILIFTIFQLTRSRGA